MQPMQPDPDDQTDTFVSDANRTGGYLSFAVILCTCVVSTIVVSLKETKTVPLICQYDGSENENICLYLAKSGTILLVFYPMFALWTQFAWRAWRIGVNCAKSLEIECCMDAATQVPTIDPYTAVITDLMIPVTIVPILYAGGVQCGTDIATLLLIHFAISMLFYPLHVDTNLSGQNKARVLFVLGNAVKFWVFYANLFKRHTHSYAGSYVFFISDIVLFFLRFFGSYCRISIIRKSTSGRIFNMVVVGFTFIQFFVLSLISLYQAISMSMLKTHVMIEFNQSMCESL